MTKFLEKSFSVHLGNAKYREGWDATFGKWPAPTEAPKAEEEGPCTRCDATGLEFPACGESSPPCPRCRGTKKAW